MGIDIITMALSANRTKDALERNGQIGHEGVKTVELVPKAEYEFDKGTIMLPVPQSINVGDELIIAIDGIEYKATAALFGGIVCAGNSGAFGGEDTGEPYLVGFGETDGELLAQVVLVAELDGTETTQHTVSVVANVKTVYPIDPKYLPRTVVDLTDVLDAYLGTNAADGHTLDGNRITAFIEGFEEKNLVFVHKTTETDNDITHTTAEIIPATYHYTRNESAGTKAYYVRVYFNVGWKQFVLSEVEGEYRFDIMN